MSAYGNKLNPFRRTREPRGIRGIRQSVVITNNPSTTDQNHQLRIRFPNLSSHDLIVPGTTKVAFEIEINSATDTNASVYQNLGRSIVKKTIIRISGNEVLCIDDSDIFFNYVDQWKSPSELLNLNYQGIGTENMLKHRVNAADKKNTTVQEKEDEAIGKYFGKRFCVPLDFELLESHMPFYQAGLGDRLEYELTFNNYENVIKSTDTSATYTIKNIALEFDLITNPELARMIKQEITGKFVIFFDRVLRHQKFVKNQSETVWNLNLNIPSRSMKGILLLFEDPERTDTTEFINPKISKVEMTIEGVPNQLYAQGMKYYQQYTEALRFFGFDSKKDRTINKIQKELLLTNVSLGKYLTSKYCLWLDLRSTDDNYLHGTGRRIENASEGITIQITKEAGTDKEINVYVFTIQDAQINFEDGRFKEVHY